MSYTSSKSLVSLVGTKSPGSKTSNLGSTKDVEQDKEVEEDNGYVGMIHVVLLEEILQSVTATNALIKALSTDGQDYCLRLRFCSAVGEYLDTFDRMEQANKGKVIVSLFIAEGSIAQIQGVPPGLASKLLRGDRVKRTLAELKTTIIANLAAASEVQQVVGRVHREME
jgi:hypothetical protein